MSAIEDNMRLVVSVPAAVAAAVCLTAPSPASAAYGVSAPVNAQTAYSSVPQVLPGDVSSLGFEASSASEIGDEVGLVPASGGPRRRVLTSLRVVMSSQQCQTRLALGDTCVTTPGSYFSHPITASVYAVDGSSGTPRAGALLASRTRSFDIAFRPSQDDKRCKEANLGKWFDVTTNTCFSGVTQNIVFHFPRGVPLPRQVIWTVAYDTTHYGYHPIGEGAPCFSTRAGCGYDSLNVGVQTFPGSPFTGTHVVQNRIFLASTSGPAYCDGGTGGIGFFRLDTPCWTGFTPLAEIKAKDTRPT
jgi:hypothetical protein